MTGANQIELQEVESGNIARIGYDKESATLVVEFKHGGKYAYTPVPEEVHQALIEAKSIGRHFAAYLKNNPAYTSTNITFLVEDETA